ncbi:hypothetical protein BH23GEM4_BH23GEM4_06190 [soil metagenome]
MKSILIAVAILALGGAGSEAGAQLRPLDPFEWRVLEGTSLVGSVGVAVLADQRASLARTDGRLVELGDLALTWRTGRVAFEAGGTVQRLYHVERVLGPAEGEVTATDENRHDAGVYRVGAAFRLTSDGAPVAALLRFGTRLPTTNNRVGLDRDATDFYALLGGRLARSRFAVGAEAGLGINGTRNPGFEQSDVLLYAVQARYDGGAIIPVASLAGQVNSASADVRGTETLGEVRAGVRLGSDEWLRVEVVRGYAEISPSWGVRAAVGIAR